MARAEHPPDREPGATVVVTPLDMDDLSRVRRHIAFETAHGHARFESPEQLRAWVPTVDAAILLCARQEGVQVGSAAASIVPVLGSGCVNLNAHFADGRSDVLRELTRAVASWSAARDADELMAFVTSPTDEQQQVWLDAGYAHVGTRSRLVREVSSADAQVEAVLPDGLQIVPLAQRPELENAALALWNACHLDVPTPLPFHQITIPEWRIELGIDDAEPYPSSLQVAVTPDGGVAGVAYLDVRDPDRGVAGHRFTGVDPAWRGRGIAGALKLSLLRWAAENGFRQLQAHNDDTNPAMRTVNERLGYLEELRIVLFRRELPLREQADQLS